MGEIIKFPGSAVVPTSNAGLIKRAKSFEISAGPANYGQYGNTVKAYAAAGMPFDHIANAGESLGDKVVRKETDAPFVDSSQGLEKKGEIVEDQNQIMAWQARGERIAVVHQLASPLQGTEVAIASGNLVTAGLNQQSFVEVLEGINVSKGVQGLPNNQESNPFLKAPASLDKAA